MACKFLLSSLFLVFIKHDEGSLEVDSIINGLWGPLWRRRKCIIIVHCVAWFSCCGHWFVNLTARIVVVKINGPPILCKTDEIGEICVQSTATGGSYWGLQGKTAHTFKWVVCLYLKEGLRVAIVPSIMECIVLHNAAGYSIPISSSLNHYFFAKIFSCYWEPGMEDLWIFLDSK